MTSFSYLELLTMPPTTPFLQLFIQNIKSFYTNVPTNRFSYTATNTIAEASPLLMGVGSPCYRLREGPLYGTVVRLRGWPLRTDQAPSTLVNSFSFCWRRLLFFLAFFFRMAINFPKMVKNSNFFCSITSYAPNDTEKSFCDHWSHIREMNSRFLKKIPFLLKSRWG